MSTMSAKGRPMMDPDQQRRTPKVGEDFNPNMQIAGKPANLPDRDGPAKRSANPTAKKPATSSGKGKVVIKPAKAVAKSAAKKTDPKLIAAMRASLKRG